jgi:hypothetical protein
MIRADLSDRVIGLLSAREGESPGRGASAVEIGRALGVNVVVIARTLHALDWEERVVLLHGQPTVAEALR